MPPPQGMWQTLEKNDLGKKIIIKENTTTCQQSKTKNQGKITGKPKHKAPVYWRRARNSAVTTLASRKLRKLGGPAARRSVLQGTACFCSVQEKLAARRGLYRAGLAVKESLCSKQ